MMGSVADCNVTIIGAGPYGLSSAAYLRAAGVETRVFGEPMTFWENHMPAGMCLRSNWGASHIADPRRRAHARRVLPPKWQPCNKADSA